MTCEDCKGTGVYQGLGLPEDCKGCGGTGKAYTVVDDVAVPTSLLELAARNKAIRAEREAELCRVKSKMPPGKGNPAYESFRASKGINDIVADTLAEVYRTPANREQDRIHAKMMDRLREKHCGEPVTFRASERPEPGDTLADETFDPEKPRLIHGPDVSYLPEDLQAPAINWWVRHGEIFGGKMPKVSYHDDSGMVVICTQYIRINAHAGTLLKDYA